MSKKVIKLTEETLRECVKESVKKILTENYRMDSLDELLEYMWLRPNETNLNVDIFVDDGSSYIRHGHKLLLFVRNGYNKNINEFIPFSISNHPTILDDDIILNISYDDIFSVQSFIVTNLTLLQQLADREISQISFVDLIKPSLSAVCESKELLSEMATLRKEDSCLPMDIWLDEGGTFQGHAPRLKFRASQEQRTTREFSSMLLMNPPKIENMPKHTILKRSDIQKLENFVINNLELLLKLANGQINFRTQFLPNIKKGI